MLILLTGCAGTVSSSEEVIDYGSGEIIISVNEELVDLTDDMVKKFFESNPSFDYTYKIVTDEEADLFIFDQKDLFSLIDTLNVIDDDYSLQIMENNTEVAYNSCLYEDKCYAFPLCFTDAYILYYDSSVLIDVSSIESIIKTAKENGKNICFDFLEPVDILAFIFSGGSYVSYNEDNTSVYLEFNEEEALSGLKTLIGLKDEDCLSDKINENTIAFIGNNQDKTTAEKLYGENLKTAVLPSYTADGISYDMVSAVSLKMLGIGKQEEQGKLLVAEQLASYLCNKDNQRTRYEELSCYPTNISLRVSLGDDNLNVLNAQMDNAYSLGNYPAEFLTLTASLGYEIKEGNYDDLSDEELLNVLKSYKIIISSLTENEEE